MTTDTGYESGVEMRQQLGEFVTCNLENASLGWPLRSSPRTNNGQARADSGSAAGLRVLILGQVELELPVTVDATRRQLMERLRGRCRTCRFRWSVSALRPAGPLADAIRAASALGAKASVCTTLPVPLPAPLRLFFEEHGVSQHNASAVPGQCALAIALQCRDGLVVFRRRGVGAATGSGVPRGMSNDFDVVVTVASPHVPDCDANRSLARLLDHGSTRPIVGLRLDSRTSATALAPARYPNVWTFIHDRDARQLARRVGAEPAGSTDALVRLLRHRFGIARPVLQCGPCETVLLNGEPCPYHVYACPLATPRTSGADITFLTVTVLSKAAGASDQTSLQRGVAAATGQDAGLPLPTCLDELDCG